MKVVCISDTHGDHLNLVLPQGDVLVHAGDMTAHGTEDDLRAFLEWFSAQEFAHKIFIAGNHDSFLEQNPVRTQALVDEAGVHYLNDSGIAIDGVQFWGSPITPRFYNWAFMRDPGADIEKHWSLIPLHTNVLITHGPPWGILDEVERSEILSEHTGCPSLLQRIEEIKPDYHLFGHIHEEYGQVERDGVRYMNISTMNKEYRINNAPIIIEFNTAGSLSA